MGASASVSSGTLDYATGPGESNSLTITLAAGGDLTVSGNVPLTAGAGCTAGADANSATCTGATLIDVILGNLGDTIVINGQVPATITGGAGADHVTGGTAGDSINVRSPGPDTVSCDGEDVVTSDPDDTVTGTCAPNVAPVAEIIASPGGPTNDATPTFSFQANEQPVQFQCQLLPVDASPADCSPPLEVSTLAEGDYTMQVRAVDDVGPGPWVTRSFTVDTTAPQVIVTRLAPTNTSTAHFQLDTFNDPAVTFECRIGGGTSEPCADIFTTPILADGDYTLSVTGTDAAGNKTTTPVPFTIDAVPNGGGTGPPTPPSVQPRRIIIESLVLISGRPVKMSRRGVVSIGLQCAGTKRCKGRMTITTAQPVSRKRRKLERLGSTKFSIAANKKRRVKVDFSKSKTKLARRLKRFKAKVVITEVDQRGNARVSSRVFVLRAR